LKLGTKLALSLPLIIIFVLSGHGYYHIVSRRDILARMMKAEVESIGQTLRVSLEKLSHLREKGYVQEIIDAVDEYEKTLGVVVYLQEENLIFRSHSLNEGTDPYLELIKRSIDENRSQEEFGVYKRNPVFSYTLPFKDRSGRNIGGISILQHTSFVEEDSKKAEWSIFIAIFVLTAGSVTLILLLTRIWITLPIAQLMDGIKNLARGDLNTQIDLKRGDELSELAQTFNKMAINLKKAQEEIVQEAETKLQLERELRQSEKLAVVGQLASGLGHEIGTPLNIISGRAEWVKRKLEDNGEAQKNLGIILQQTEKITKIIQQLLGFARKKRPELKTLNFSTLLETTLDLLDYQIQRQGVKVVKEIEGLLPPVTGDPDQLQQVFSNLFLNAIQAMPDGGMLRLSVASKWISKEGFKWGRRPYIEVSIEDTGVGMEKEVLENIFKPFFTTKEGDKGTGLGLTVSHGIIQDHEGWIEVESRVGKGSLFKIYLPALREEVGGEG
jgi:two-component system, NtrC family, sensor kinase